jgi:hypothetical protein
MPTALPSARGIYFRLDGIDWSQASFGMRFAYRLAEHTANLNGVRAMPELSLDHAKRLIHEIEKPGNDPTPRLLEIASILVGLVERLTTRVDELEHGGQGKAHNR